MLLLEEKEKPDSNPNTEIMARINQEINKCERALDDMCKGIYSS